MYEAKRGGKGVARLAEASRSDATQAAGAPLARMARIGDLH